MKIEQIYTGCLAQGAYYIENQGEVAIIDPLRESQPYIERATKDGAKIKYIFETHFHADFVSGHVDLASKTKAKIIYGPTLMKTGFDAYIAKDGEQFHLGDITFTLLHTPGHTMESSCFLLTNNQGKDVALFTGDTLFIGDVGRPDLAQHVISELTEEKLAGHLYDSLRNKILHLADDLIIYPAHGAGSACGKKMSNETSDTLGNQKTTNYALNQNLSKEQFIKELLQGLTPPPSYFPKNVLLNINGYDTIDDVIAKGIQAWSVEEFEELASEHSALILDTRNAELFAKGFIPNSINIGIDGSFAVWAGTLILDLKQPILLVTDHGSEKTTITRLARVGFDNVIGYLNGGFDAWKKSGKDIETIFSIDVEEMREELAENKKLSIIDVRKKSEYDAQHITNAQNLPLDYLNQYMNKIEQDKTYFVHCAAGYRSMIFISILKARGYHNLINVKGGFNSIKSSELYELTEYVCPSTML